MTSRLHGRSRRRWFASGARRLAVAGLALLALAPSGARAWDPSTTHAEMTRRAVTGSAMHLRWMDGSDLQRGVFSSVRLDPGPLPDDIRRRIRLALRQVHADSGAAGLGGPGACPGPTAPLPTRAYCVEGDVWELSAIGWIQLGMIAEIDPRDRILHHFADRDDPAAVVWKDRKLPRAILRAEHRRSGGSISETLTGTAFAGKAPSVIAWIDDRDDPWAPPQTLRHLREASLAETPAARQQALAQGLLGLGALLHVVQDLSVPAHARGDITAFFSPLSRTTGDRGLPLQEFVRVEYGRTRLPTALALGPRQTERGIVLSDTLRGHLLGDEGFVGLVPMAGHRFLSETSLPEIDTMPPNATAEQAAEFLLADAGLDPVEVEGAKLAPWPADAGYLVSAGGRPLAAFEADAIGQVQLYLDRRVYRDQAGHLVPLGVEVSRSILDLLVPAFPPHQRVSGSDVLAIDLRTWAYAQPALRVIVEGRDGVRRVVRRVKLRPGERNRVTGAIPKVADDERVVLVVVADGGGLPITAEKVWVDRPTPPPKPTPSLADPTPVPAGDDEEPSDAPPAAGDAPVAPPASDDADAPAAPDAASEPADGDAPTDAEAPEPAAPASKVPAGAVPKPAAPTPDAPRRGPAIPTKRPATPPAADPDAAADPDDDSDDVD